MGASIGKSGGPQRSGRRRGGHGAMSEINVTPFVDVMLVLLIIFMITAPLLTAGIPVDLPDSSARPLNQEDTTPIEISVRGDGRVYVGETEVNRAKLLTLLEGMTQGDAERRIFIRGDKSLDYGLVMGIIADVNRAGFRKVALLTDSTDG